LPIACCTIERSRSRQPAYDLRATKQLWRRERRGHPGGRVLVGTLDARLRALDARTGNEK
jgi:hypothetical protein